MTAILNGLEELLSTEFANKITVEQHTHKASVWINLSYFSDTIAHIDVKDNVINVTMAYRAISHATNKIVQKHGLSVRSISGNCGAVALDLVAPDSLQILCELVAAYSEDYKVYFIRMTSNCEVIGDTVLVLAN